jgi:hypothetical protein
MTRIDLDARKAKKEAARANQYPRVALPVAEPVVVKKAKKKTKKSKKA